MTQANHVLDQQRAKVSDLERQLEIARAELRGMELYASSQSGAKTLHAAPAKLVTAYDNSPKRSSGGRQPGSISKRWRAVLDDLHTFSTTHWFTVHDVIDTVRRLEDRAMKPAEVRRQLEKYIDLDYVENDGGDRYRITDTAIEKYEMGAAKAHKNTEQSAQKENAPQDDASDIIGGADASQGSGSSATEAWRNPQSVHGG